MRTPLTLAMAMTLVLLGSAARVPAARADDTPASREELEAEQHTIERHLLRVQQERFEAEARGDDPAKVRRLDREFHRTGVRRGDIKRQIEAAK